MKRVRVATPALMLGVASLGVLLDQLTKQWALGALVEITADEYNWFGGFLRFRLAFNSGAAFGLGAELTVFFSVLALTTALALVVFTCIKPGRLWMGALSGVFLAGIVGNLVDRITREPGPFQGRVVDFIAVKWFAVFNVADMLITLGVVWLFLWVIVSERRKLNPITGLPEGNDGEMPDSTTEDTAPVLTEDTA